MDRQEMDWIRRVLLQLLPEIQDVGIHCASRYVLSVWHERGKPEIEAEFPRAVSIATDSAVLAAIHLRDTGKLFVPHKNKYGDTYETPTPKGLIYK